MWCRGSGELDFILVYRNSGEWKMGSWVEKRFVCAQISVPSAVLQKQLLVCKISVPSSSCPEAAVGFHGTLLQSSPISSLELLIGFFPC